MRENSSRNQGGLKYQKLYNWGRTLIMSGVLRNMDKFPSEHMLQNKFGYSRQTVRNALDRLEQDGLIARVKGSGTYVSYAPEKDTSPHRTDSQLFFRLPVSAGVRGNRVRPAGGRL